MLEVIAFIGGIFILSTNRIPHVLFGGNDTYSIAEDDARTIGFLLLAPLFLALFALCLLAPVPSLVIRAIYYGLVIFISILYRLFRYKRTVDSSGMLIGTTIPAEKAHIEETIARKTYRSLLPLMLCITGIPALILGPLAMFRTRQAIKLSNEHQIGLGHRTWAYIICILSGLGTVYGLVPLILIPILVFSGEPLFRVPTGTPAFSRSTSSTVTVMVDPQKTVEKRNEENNQFTPIVLTLTPELTYTPLSTPGTPVPSDTPAPTGTPTPTLTPTKTPTEAPSKTSTPKATHRHRIAFVSDRDGNVEIFSMYSDGIGLTRLTNSPEDESYPGWSPDGTRIAFYRTKSSDNLYVMNADGTGLTALPGHAAAELTSQAPTWSPDGLHLAFTSSDADGATVSTINIDGSNLRALAPGLLPVWSRDGRQIAYLSRSNAPFLMNADGTNPHQLAQLTYLRPYPPNWSPDGTQLLFMAAQSLETPAMIYIVNADGSGFKVVTDQAYYGYGAPEWAPDGQWITFVIKNGSTSEIYRIRSDGTELTQLTYNSMPEFSPLWAFDGSLLAFTGEMDIWVMYPDGGDVRRLTDHPAVDRAPRWQP